MKELYFSVDIEADGPIPGEYSMLSLGAAAFDYTNESKIVSTWSANMETLENAKEHPDTMKWWATQPEAWEIVQNNKINAEQAIKDFAKWVKIVCKEHNAKPVFLAYPSGFDFTFVYWYLIKFNGSSPFAFSALDIKSFAMAKLNTPFRATVKKNMLKEWFSFEHKHTHVALDDAIEQGYLFGNILKYNEKI